MKPPSLPSDQARISGGRRLFLLPSRRGQLRHSPPLPAHPPKPGPAADPNPPSPSRRDAKPGFSLEKKVGAFWGAGGSGKRGKREEFRWPGAIPVGRAGKNNPALVPAKCQHGYASETRPTRGRAGPPCCCCLCRGVPLAATPPPPQPFFWGPSLQNETHPPLPGAGLRPGTLIAPQGAGREPGCRREPPSLCRGGQGWLRG